MLRGDAKAFLRASLVVLRLAEIYGGLGDGVGEGFAVGADGGVRRVRGIGGELVFLRDDGAEDAVGERLELLAGLGAGVRAAEVVRGGGAADGAAGAEHAAATRHAGFRVAVPAVAGLAGERVEVVRRRFLQGLLAPETTGEGALRGRRGEGTGEGSAGRASRAIASAPANITASGSPGACFPADGRLVRGGWGAERPASVDRAVVGRTMTPMVRVARDPPPLGARLGLRAERHERLLQE